MQILFLSDNFPPETNAAASRVFERARMWVEWGHAVTVITGAPNFPQGKLYPGYRNRWYQVEYLDGVRVVRVKTFIAANQGVWLRTIDFLSFMVSSFIAGLFQKKPDILVATSPQFFTALGGYGLAAVRGIPFIFELGDLWPASIVAVGMMKPSLLLRIFERLELFLYRRARKVIALTNAFKINLMTRGISETQLEVVMNGVDTTRFMPRPKSPILMEQYALKDKFVVGYIGTHGLAHELNALLLAAVELKEEKDIAFILVGDGAHKRSLQQQAQMLGLRNIIFIEAQPKSQIHLYWSLLDLALIHLKQDPIFATVIPSKGFEAMAMGVPLIFRGPAGEMSQLIEKEQVGLTVTTGKASDLAKAILILKQDRVLQELYKKHAITAVQRYSRQQQARRFIEVMGSAL